MTPVWGRRLAREMKPLALGLDTSADPQFVRHRRLTHT